MRQCHPSRFSCQQTSPTADRRQCSPAAVQPPALSLAAKHLCSSLDPTYCPLLCRLALPGTSAALSCKKVQLCHNSNGVAYTTMDLFSSLEPIFSTLGLGAVNEYVDVVALPPMAIHGCSCSTPVEVGFSLPASNGHTAASVGRMVEAFIEEHLAARMRNLACHSEVEEAQCQPDQLAAARRLLR